jgi:hypothetical protein
LRGEEQEAKAYPARHGHGGEFEAQKAPADLEHTMSLRIAKPARRGALAPDRSARGEGCRIRPQRVTHSFS